MRKFGLDVVGDIPWGIHLCQFYETKHDLAEILVPYFAEGLRSNEACMWVTSEPLEVDAAKAALANAVPNIDWFIESGQLLILPYTEWYLKGGEFDADRVLKGWVEKEQEALSRGFEGLRLTGNTFWIERSLWDSFTDYEETVNNVIGAHRMIAVCTYSLEKCSGSDVTDVIRNHVGTIIKKGESWSVVEDVLHRKEAEMSLQQAHEEVQALNEELQSTNEELRLANESLDERVTERTNQLQNEIEERKVVEEELRTTTEELQVNVKELRRAEQAVREHAKKIDSLNQIIRASNEATDITSLATALVDRTIDLLDFDAGTFSLFNEAENVTELQYSRGFSPDYVRERARISVNEPHLIRLYRDHKPLWPEHMEILRPELSKRERVTAIAAVPLIAGGRVIGALSITSRRRHQFTDEEKDLLLAIGREAGTVVAKLKVEEDLRQRGEMLDLANDAVIIRDTDDRITYWNNGAERLYGWKAEEVLGKVTHTLFQTVFPESLDATLKALHHNGHWEGELAHWTSDGHFISVKSLMTMYSDETGMPMSTFEINYDTTGQKRAEERLQWNAEVDAALTALYATFVSPVSTIDDMSTVTLEEAKKLTGSQHGYTALIDPATHDMISFSHTRMVLSECDIPEAKRKIRFPRGTDGQYPGLWGHALNTKEGFYTNAPETHSASMGIPEGHTPLYQFLAVPALIGDEVVAKIALANPGRDYTERDLEAVQRLVEFYTLAIQRKWAEEKVRAGSLYSRSLLEASLDPLVTISAEGKITDVNKATEDVTGVSRKQLIGSDFSSYFTKPEKARNGYHKVFTDGFVQDYPLSIRHTSGRITDVLYNATVYRNEAGEVQGVFAAARDVTERKKAEEALQRAHDELEQIVQERTRDLQEEIEERKMTEEELRTTTEELQEKTTELEELTQELRRSNTELEQFAYIASHDLQEPLRTVTSSLGLLEKWYKDKLGEEADTFINYAVDGTKHMQQLIKDLLAYSRVMSRGEEFKPVHCDSVVEHAIDNLKTAIEESGVKIRLPDKPLPTIMGDKTQLTQLFQNLIGNAIKFRSERPPEVQIDVELDAKRKRWQFSITDNGIGMDMQYADKIFTIFQRLHTTEQYPGTGVGLALCKRIVERHSGEIWVGSALGKGTTFFFTLPF